MKIRVSPFSSHLLNTFTATVSFDTKSTPCRTTANPPLKEKDKFLEEAPTESHSKKCEMKKTCAEKKKKKRKEKSKKKVDGGY